jgi:hypothetical protein
MTGKVKEILKSGDIDILWANGEQEILKRWQLEEVYRQRKRYRLMKDD